MRVRVLFPLLLVLCACSGEPAGDTLVAAGKQMYREGILPSGEPMTAIVAGDVPIVGTQFSCESCHGRSGMGASEGAYVVPAIGAQFLFSPSPQPARPAYDKDSLARVLREGVTPSGRELMVELMPRYELSDNDVDAMVSYLQTLSASDSPGVDDKSIHVAVVVAGDVEPDRRDAVFDVLERFAGDINTETRNDSARWDRQYTPESKLPTVFREWVLHEWKLTGPPTSWDAQLQNLNTQTPVFAMLGGTGSGTWAPIGEFCERYEILCLYPSTNLPHISDDDFYTVYYSRGLLLEADLIAAHIEEQPTKLVLQVWCDSALEPAAAALRESLKDSATVVRDVTFDCDDPAPFAELAPQLADGAAAVLWLDTEQLTQVTLPAGRIYASSALLDSTPEMGLATATGSVLVAHPFRLPNSIDPAARRFEAWAKSREVVVSHRRAQAEAFYAALVFKNVVKHMRRYYVREYALDVIDHSEGMAAYLPLYPRASFGPGQRYINKGGYILPIVNGKADTKDAAWILP
jgi:hypothetical protein